MGYSCMLLSCSGGKCLDKKVLVEMCDAKYIIEKLLQNQNSLDKIIDL